MKTRVAMLTPSSNTIVEPWCARILRTYDDVSVHFGRVEVLRIDDDEESLSQFQEQRMLDAIRLLSHVRPRVIGWNGTSASWLGVERDRDLVRAIERDTGLPAITSTLSILDALQRLGLSQIGLVTPYVASIQEKIVANFADEGLTCVSERHFDESDNFAFGVIPGERIAQAARETAADGAKAIVILCTNLEGADIAAAVERETGVPVLDSVNLTVWGALRAAGIETSRLAPWGPAVAKIA